jgi:DNA topoisomerase-1
MNDMYVWGGLVIAVIAFAWLLWPKDEKPAQLDSVKPEPAPVPMPEPVKEETAVVAKKDPAKKTAAPKKTAPAKKAPAKKAAPKKAVKKGRK